MAEPSLYAELKTWQQGLAALVGFIALMAAALWNFHLNRKRDAALRTQEVNSVAAALYGEVVLLRLRAAQIAQLVANVYIEQGTRGDAIMKFDNHFVEANRIPEPMLYKALASKFGLLPSSLIGPLASFYENIQMIGFWLPQLVPQIDRPYSYSPLTVLKPARDAVQDVVPALKEIEVMTGMTARRSLDVVDLRRAESVIEMEQSNWQQD